MLPGGGGEKLRSAVLCSARRGMIMMPWGYSICSGMIGVGSGVSCGCSVWICGFGEFGDLAGLREGNGRMRCLDIGGSLGAGRGVRTPIEASRLPHSKTPNSTVLPHNFCTPLLKFSAIQQYLLPPNRLLKNK